MDIILLSTAVMVVIALLTTLLLLWANKQFAAEEEDLVKRIDDLLPQTQCAQCGYPGCKPYAEAIAEGDAHNKCPPGGERAIADLSNLLGREIIPLVEEQEPQGEPKIAFIREEECIGCVKCIHACPVDAIVGAAKLMHTVISDQCTGCDLCVEPCPMDCIDMLTADELQQKKVNAQLGFSL